MHWAWLELELRRWRGAGRSVTLWWRDDDARAPSEALDRLLDVARRAPLTLAVIPDDDVAGLARSLAAAPSVTVVQHGVDHQNRRTGPLAGEFPHEWRRIRVATQMRAGWSRLSVLPGAERIYVPPWNDIHPELPQALEDCGYVGWSAWGRGAMEGTPPRLDAHLDLMRWKGGARFRGEAKFVNELRGLLAARRRSGRWDAPIGLLTHHLAHDAAAWGFLERFVDWSLARPDLAWASLPRLLGREGPAEPAALIA